MMSGSIWYGFIINFAIVILHTMKHFITHALFLLGHIAAFCQPEINWQQSFGGSDFDLPSEIKATPDGGFILAATTFSNDGDAAGNHGADDILLIKLKADRSVQWRKVLGGSNEDGLHDLQLTSDGGFIAAGFTKSRDGDVTELKGQSDYWVIKLNAAGTVEWQRTYGGSNNDVASSVKQTSDGGFIVAGYTSSNNGDVTNNHIVNVQDAWILKLDASGQILWQQCYGGTDAEFAYDIDLAPGGFIFTGYARSRDGDLSVNKGVQDAWIVKLGINGNIEWQQVLGGLKNETGNKIKTLTGGGYIMAGSTTSNDGDVQGQHGASDGWLVKLSASGNVDWKRCYGGSSLENFLDIFPSVQGYLVVGAAESADHDVAANYGKSDYWVLQLDANGTIVWQINTGGSEIDDGHAACFSSNGEIIISGTSFSRDKDVKQWIDAGDIWVVSFKESKPLPLITKQPRDTMVCERSVATFSVEEMHSTGYQWQVLRNNIWINITGDQTYSGTQTKVLSVNTTRDLNGSQYRCVLSNNTGITHSQVVELGILNKPLIITHPAGTTACEGSIVKLNIIASGADGYQWQDNSTGAGWQNINGANQFFYQVTIRDDNRYRCVVSNGCGNDTSNIALITRRNCSITNAFSPNADGINDHWQLPFLSGFPGCSVLIFDRFGKKVFESRGYRVPWDGRFNGKILPAGVYYYLLDLKDGSKPLTGSLTLLN
jgi:gliding motility-associated-like protein